ncbi:beta-1,4-N-acetylgalactosaminyltransferase bre-4 [Culicoides brevitarsis]|uniref:beta-1,4-N-acetylgalactosaminyltransferase bre-4 n=1 Tax=Culicoides brevitarsis TaxID=469753 RepID=UPI00307C223C
MAPMLGRTQAIKAAFVVGFLLLLLNLLGPRLDANKPFTAHLSNFPKRTFPTNDAMAIHATNASVAPSAVSNNATIDTNSNNKSEEERKNGVSFIAETEVTSQDEESQRLMSYEVTSNEETPKKKLYANSTVIVLTNPESGEEITTTTTTTVKPQVVTTKAVVTKPKSRKEFIEALMQQLGINPCPMVPDDLEGPIQVDTMYETLEAVEEHLRGKVLSGGRYHPKKCNSKHRVAIIVPYRDREHHLPIFLKNIHPFLMKQQIDYGIFIVEQTSNGQFNRAKLMNIGFVEAVKLYNWDCFVFHDVDLLPMDDRNLYTCPEQPRHMSVAVDTLGFKLPYSTIFGGVSAMTVEQFLNVNGFSNSFWGWGGEDDDMSNRLKHRGYHISRYPVNIARYTMLTHKKEKANPRRYEKLQNGVKHFDNDGLNSLKYKVIEIKKTPLFIRIKVDINQDQTAS